MAYPNTAPSYTPTDANATLATNQHAARHTQEEADIVALAAKLGTGASTPSADTVLLGTGAGASAFGKVALSTHVDTFTSAELRGRLTDETGTGSAVFATSPTIVTPTLTSPTVSSFANSQHDHTNAANGGSLGNNSVTPTNISTHDWFRYLPALAYSTVVAGTWIGIGTTGTGSITGMPAAQSAGAQNEEIQFKVVLAAGTYRLHLHADRDINRGIYTISVDGNSVGTVDGYAATRVAGVVTDVSTSIVISSNKLVTVNVKMASKNASSAAYYANFFGILLVRTA